MVDQTPPLTNHQIHEFRRREVAALEGIAKSLATLATNSAQIGGALNKLLLKK